MGFLRCPRKTFKGETMPHTQTTTRAHHTHLPLDEIQRLLDEGHKQCDVALLFGTTQPTISRLCRNRNSPAGKTKRDPGAPVCSCCGDRAVAKGNRFLCSWCFSHGDAAGASLPEHALAI